MNTMNTLKIAALSLVALGALGGCGNMSTRDRDTAIGAGVGAVGGSILPVAAPSAPLVAQPWAASSAMRLAKANAANR